MKMRRSSLPIAGRWTVVCVVVLLLPFPVSGQKEFDTRTAQDRMLHTTIFQTPYGKIKVTLPGHIESGDTVSGTIALEPKGEAESDLYKNTDWLNHYVVAIDATKVSTSHKVIKLTIPVSFPAGAIDLFLKENGGREITRTDAREVATRGAWIFSAPPTLGDLGVSKFQSVGEWGNPW